VTYDTTARCPYCCATDVYGFKPTLTGRAYYCPHCGRVWKLTTEDAVLGMIGPFLAARHAGGEGHTPESR
jgi:hypothetical protein